MGTKYETSATARFSGIVVFSVCQLGFELVQFCEPARSKLVEEQIFARNSRWVPLFF